MNRTKYHYKCYSILKTFQSPILKQIHVLDPICVRKKSDPSIAPLASLFPGIVKPNQLNEIDAEWRILRNNDIDVPPDANIEKFWQTVAEMMSGHGNSMFPLLSHFVSCMLCLPHSSAAAERMFSAVNNMKTKQRNRLSTKTLIGLLHSKRYMKNEICSSFCVKNDLLQKMNADIYKDDSDSE